VEHERVATFVRTSGLTPHRPERPAGRRLCLALRRGRTILGVQIVRRREAGGPFPPRAVRIAEGVAQLASMALANSRLHEELAHASRLKTEFVSTMSHELRTPLNVILGFADMLRDPAFGAHERAGIVDTIERAGRELLGLVESTLEVGRIEAGRQQAVLQPTALVPFWRGLEASCAMLPRPTAVALDWAPAPPDVTLVTDPQKLTIVLRNLIGNALKFTEQGVVRVDADAADGHVRFRVRDTGIGIAPADHATIFEMFRQADGSDSRRFGGTGLGLYIVRRFVDLLGGDVALESAPGGGSTFVVTLPAGGPSASRARAA
jgi:signal transduction histidine kinase